MKHFFIEKTDTIGHYAIVDEEGLTVCKPSPMGRENAALIYAAPYLFDACAAALALAQGDDTIPAERVQRMLKDALRKTESGFLRWFDE